MFGLKLSQKALVLIAIPAIFQVVFVAILGLLLKQAEYEIWRERHAKEVIAESNALLSSFIGAVSGLYLYSASGSPVYRQRYLEQAKRIPRQIQALQVMLRDSPNQKDALERIRPIANKGMLLLAEGERFADEGKPRELISGRSELGAISTELVTQLKQFVKEQENAQALNPEIQAAVRMRITQWMIAGIVLNLAIVVVAAWLIHKTALTRLAVLVENTSRLTAGKELHQPLSGSDELSYLDRVFHTMAEELREAARRKQEMIALVSHDLRTPLTSVKASLTMVCQGIFGNVAGKAVDELNDAAKNTNRLLCLVNNLLDIERLEAGLLVMAPQAVPLEGIIEASLLAVGNAAEVREIELEPQDTDLIVEADGERIVQVLVNLLANAIKFSPAECKVAIAVAEHPLDWAEIKVSDTGRGIPQDHQELIFERFHQVKAEDSRPGQGTGLGLPICKAIVSAHGGSIGVDSKEGQGSTFWFRLPLAKPGQNLIS